MNLQPALGSPLNWLITHSLEAALLVGLVLAVQWLFRGRLSHRWRFALWWIVLGRLVLPFSLPSTFSLFNLFPSGIIRAHPAPTSAPAILRVEGAPAQTPFPSEPAVRTEPIPPLVRNTFPASLPSANNPGSATALPRSYFSASYLIPALIALWLVGALALTVTVAIQLLKFRRQLTRATVAPNPEKQALLDDCRRTVGVSRPIELLETDAVTSPALFGLFRLRLLLPRRLAGQFSTAELRYIFLHEAAHVKRGDLWLNWLVTVLQIVHWFNPLLWFGFARLRADRELACDELALVRAGDQTGAAYGETVVKLLETMSRPAAIPGLIGILEDKDQMARRISMIANFRRPGRWSVLALILLLIVATVALTDAQTENSPSAAAATPATNFPARPDLTGSVSTPGSDPLPSPATVFIETAAPKTGSSAFCPSCYPDCIKHAQTDVQGRFKIESLDPQLTFRILAVAKGCKPEYLGHVDPAKGPVRMHLVPIASADASPDRSLRGRVVNAKNEPIAGAVVEMEEISRPDGSGGGGSIPGVDPLAVTDDQGEFLLTAKEPFATMGVSVSARSYADKKFHDQHSGGATNTLVLTEGAGLIGRVLHDGQPLAGVSVGVSAVDRSFPNYLGHFEVATAPSGAFTFINLPPDADFWIYTLMDSMHGAGAVPLRKIHTAADGQTTDVGNLGTVPAHRLAGRVVLADGQPVPPATRLYIGREEAWDSTQVLLDRDGAFSVAGVPNETVTLSTSVKGYHVSASNISLDEINPFELIGRVDHDITNLVFLLEKGPDIQRDPGQQAPQYLRSPNRTLQGAEGAADHSRERTVFGHVFDAATKQPIPEFRVTTGQTVSGRTTWNTLHAVTGSNGMYGAYISRRVAEPMLMVTAPGYLPQVTNIPAANSTVADFAFQRGSGPAGTVLKPDGIPATNATVVTMEDFYNQASLFPQGRLEANSRPAASARTDAHGQFSFPPEWGIVALATASPDGFALVDTAALATNPVIRLEALGRISGRLIRTAGPGTNEDLDLQFVGGPGPRSHLNSNFHAVTDSEGRFAFNGAPPGHLQISYRNSMGARMWENVGLKELDLKPGEAMEVTIQTGNRPAPSTMTWNPPAATPIPGKEIKGIVLLPNGEPAAEAEVALSVEGKPLTIGKGSFGDYLRAEGLATSTGRDGSFSLQLYEKAQMLVALNEDGFAQVSLAALKSSPQLGLQKWGRIEGNLRVNHQVGVSKKIGLSFAPQADAGRTNAPAPALHLDVNAFQSLTDDHGHFAFTFVPPGKHILCLRVPLGPGSWRNIHLATVDVKPGETLVTNLDNGGRQVLGRLTIPDAPGTNQATNLASAMTGFVTLSQITPSSLPSDLQPETPGARALKSFSSAGSLPAIIQPDGSFRADDIPPGEYQVNFQMRVSPESPAQPPAVYASIQNIVVPPAASENDDSNVNCGTIELREVTSSPAPAQN